jgi:branched-chain amino acid transport system substrate-binding protein
MKALKLCEMDINKRGGLLGRLIEFVIYDDKSNAEISKRLYEHLIKKDRVDFILGPYSSEITEAIVPLAEKYRYPILISGASADVLWEKGYKYIFGVYSPASRYLTGFLEMLVLNNVNGLAIVSADDPFSENVAKGTRKWAERFGLNILYFERFKKGTKNFEDIAKNIKKSGARVLIVCGHLEESIDMKFSLYNIGWHPEIYFATVGPATDFYYQRLKEKAELTFSSVQWEPSKIHSGKDTFYETFRKVYKINPSYHSATAYAACQILEAAIKKTNSLDKEKVRNTISLMDTVTILGRYKVDNRGLQIKQQNLIIQWQNGRREIVWPDYLKTAEPIFKK